MGNPGKFIRLRPDKWTLVQAFASSQGFDRSLSTAFANILAQPDIYVKWLAENTDQVDNVSRDTSDIN